jgi:hypothetical protein
MTNEFKKFDDTMRKLISIPHSIIKAKLDEEKVAKEKRHKRKEKHDSQKPDSR